ARPARRSARPRAGRSSAGAATFYSTFRAISSGPSSFNKCAPSLFANTFSLMCERARSSWRTAELASPEKFFRFAALRLLCGRVSEEEMSHKPQIMVVDDDQAICEFLRMFLDGLGYRAVTVNNAEQAVELYSAERPDAVIMDVIMPGSMDGLGALAAFKKIDREVPVIVISGQGRTATVVHAMKLGAFDFIGKPFDETDLEALLADALRQRRFNRDVSMVRNGLQHPNTHPMVFGESAEMREVKELIERVAGTDVTCLIRGESGTGKELVARALYASSQRRDKPFVKVNCAALPTELLESELFGFERGAFTGAIQQ